jgi:hypothetical protein
VQNRSMLMRHSPQQWRLGHLVAGCGTAGGLSQACSSTKQSFTSELCYVDPVSLVAIMHVEAV